MNKQMSKDLKINLLNVNLKVGILVLCPEQLSVKETRST